MSVVYRHGTGTTERERERAPKRARETEVETEIKAETDPDTGTDTDKETEVWTASKTEMDKHGQTLRQTQNRGTDFFLSDASAKLSKFTCEYLRVGARLFDGCWL